MNTRIYLNDWFVNSGIIGFIRILEHNEDNFFMIKDNYIEFDTSKLKNFHQYYFNYFCDKYNVAQKIEEKMEDSFGKIKSYLEDESPKKEIQDKLKSEKKYLKDLLKKQIEKIKKIDEEIYLETVELYNKIDIIKTNNEIVILEEIKNGLIEKFYKEHINKKITLNLFKSILSNNYFGQPGFLNVVKSALSYEEQQDIMYKDYVSNIVETSFLWEVIENKYGINDLKIILAEKRNDNLISDEFQKIYINIDKKFIQKDKDIEEIKDYIQNDVFETCSMCGESHRITSDYTEANFVPLAVSSKNMANFFWNQNVKFPICDICKLLLFCIPAGVTNTVKVFNENGVYKEKEGFTFINCDTDIKTLLQTNNYFLNNSKKDKKEYNPYQELILNIVEQDKKLSEWELQNIFVVEFEAEYRGYIRIEYFNIKRYVAKFFKYYSKILSDIKDYKYKLQIIDSILKDKDFTMLINTRLREELGEKNLYGYNSYLATKIQCVLKILKEEEINVEEKIKKANNKIHYMFSLGNDIHDELKKSNSENKLDGYIYKMLNCIKTNNKNDFIDIAIRIIWSSGKDIPEILVKNNENINWQELGHSFVAGLTSTKYRKEDDKEESENE